MLRPRPSPIDLALVAALVAWGVAEALLLDGPGARAERVGWALLTTLPLLWRRRAPVAVAGVLALAVVARVLVAHGDVAEEGAMPFPAILVAVFGVMVHGEPLRAAVAGAGVLYAAIAFVIGTSYFTGDPEPADFAVLSFFVLAAAGAGLLVRRRTAGGELAAREAVLAERSRIARELHDIVGHSVSVISLQAGAAEQLLRKDPDAAARHLEAVQQVAHEALVEMRRLMGVLREDAAPYAPQPGLDTLDLLVAQAREAGMAVDVDVRGERPAVAPGVDLAAYRIVQEALTNARKHAGSASATVRVAHAPEAVSVEVVNAGDGAPTGLTRSGGGGHGLAGLRERARLFGGTLEAAPVDGGGFRVAARLPLEAGR